MYLRMTRTADIAWREICIYIQTSDNHYKLIVQKCIVLSLLRKSVLKLVVIGSITNIHMKNTVGVKIVKTIEPWRNNASRQQHFFRKSYLPLIATSVVKKIKRKPKQNNI